MNHLEKTRETYRKIAADYALAQASRGQLISQLERFIALVPKGGLVLDVGCGPGMSTAVLQSKGLLAIGLDFSEEMMRAGRDQHKVQVPFVQADMRTLPAGSQIQGIWACASLLHLKRDDMLGTLQEFWRVLQPDGILYLSVKMGQGEAWVRTNYGHALPRFFTYWQPDALDSLLETAAFRLIEGWQESGQPDSWLVRYARKERFDEIE